MTPAYAFGMSIGRKLRYSALATILVVAGAGGFEMGRVLPFGNPLPGAHTVAGRLDEANQCYVHGTINGRRTTFLVDSGASDLALNRDFARQIGINPAQLSYNLTVTTANGHGRAASINVRELRVGDFVLRNFQALVDYDGAPEPLLGTAVLKRMHFELSRTGCALRW